MKSPDSSELVQRIRSGGSFTDAEALSLVVRLSLPAIFAQLATVVMQYIDAAMVGNLGASEAASVGLVATTTWLFWGLGSAGISGYSVLASHEIGAKQYGEARSLLRQGLAVALLLGLIMGVTGVFISPALPVWLGGAPEVLRDASLYFACYTGAMPLLFLSYMAGSMLRSTGNIRTPALLNILMCAEDVLFNFLLIFPSRTLVFSGFEFTVPGAGLGVMGAALGTVLAEICTAVPMLYAVCAKSPELRIIGEKGSFFPEFSRLKRAFRIGIPIGFQHIVMCCAYVAMTLIVAPLGTLALAAHSLAITAESLCYMPGYGVSEAATTLTGQCIGAKRLELARHLSRLTVGTGIAIMTVMALLMFAGASWMMGLMSNVPEIIDLGASILRIEAFAEPMYAASIVAYGVFVGAGDTLIPACMNMMSMWLVRLPAAFMLSGIWGIRGVWIAMCAELIFRGAIFLWRLRSGTWLKKKA